MLRVSLPGLGRRRGASLGAHSHAEAACLYPTVCILRAKDSLSVPDRVIDSGMHP